MMLNRLALITITFGIVAANYGACAQDLNKVNITTCSTDSFYDSSCTIKCTVLTNDILNSWSWQYFTTSEDTNITIYDGVQLTSQDDTYTISLTLDDYNPGTYQCLFYFNNTQSPSLSANIKISEATNGADLNEYCYDDHDCNALHATCTDALTCHCVEPYDIHYSSGSDTLACLKLQPEGGHCYSQKECSWLTQNYSCIDSHCHCTGIMTQVHTNGTEMEMCIQPVYLHDECYYDEQCKLNDEHSYCYGFGYGPRFCECEYRYITSMDDGIPKNMYCYSVFRGWEIAGIVLGILFGLALIGSAIYYFVIRKSK